MAEKTLSYEDARDQLVEVVRRLEQGGDGLAESIALWEKGEELARTCQTWLDGARERLDAVISAKRTDEDSGDTDGDTDGDDPEG